MTAQSTPPSNTWHDLCALDDLVANSGVVAWIDGRQIALFYLPQATGTTLYALDNRDPLSGANVIGRGLIGHMGGEWVIASPLYKQHFRLRDGTCLEDPGQRLHAWPVRLNGERIDIALNDCEVL